MTKLLNPVNVGCYNKDQDEYQRLVNDIYQQYSEGVTLAPEYAQFVQENLLRFFIRLARYKFVAKMLKPTDTVMEVGSGSGLGSMFLSQHCQHVTGIDVKSTEVDEARALNKRKNLDFKVQDIFTLPKNEKFDVIVSLDVIEHMSVELGHKFIKAKASHLNEHGLIIVGTPSIYSYQYQSPISQASHVNCYDLPDLLELMNNYVHRTISFSMNDELVHTGHHKMAWYYFVIGFGTKGVI